VGADGRDHCPVVGAQSRSRHAQQEAGIVASMLGNFPQPFVCCDTAGNDNGADVQLSCCSNGLRRQDVDDGLLEGRAHVGNIDGPAGPLGGFHVPGDRRLEPGEEKS